MLLCSDQLLGAACHIHLDEPYAPDRNGVSAIGVCMIFWVGFLILSDIYRNPEQGFEPPEQSHASYEASSLPPSHHGRVE